MDVVSLGLRTDLALLERAGSTLEDCGDHLVAATPTNPIFYWGSFLVLDRMPPVSEVERRQRIRIRGTGSRDARDGGRPDYAAIRIYGAVGFSASESALQVELASPPA